MSMKEKSTSSLKAMLNKGSGMDQKTVKQAIAELKRRGEETPPPALVMGGRAVEHPKAPPPRPKRKKKMAKGKAAMAKGGMANGKPHMYAGGGSVEDKMNPGLRALAEERPDVVAKMLKK